MSPLAAVAVVLAGLGAGAKEPPVFRETPAFTTAFRTQLHPGLTMEETGKLLGPPTAVTRTVFAHTPLSPQDGVVLVNVLDFDAQDVLRHVNLMVGPDGSRPDADYNWEVLRGEKFQPELARHYDEVMRLVGKSRAQVETALGPGKRQVVTRWSWMEARMPQVGETTAVYVCTFDPEGKLADSKVVPGVDVTGPAPGTRRR